MRIALVISMFQACLMSLMGQSGAFHGWRSMCITVREAEKPQSVEAATALDEALFSGMPSGAYWNCVRVLAGCIFGVSAYGLYRGFGHTGRRVQPPAGGNAE